MVVAIDPTLGGTLTYTDHNADAFAFTIPSNAVSTAVDLVLQPTTAVTVPTNLAFLGQSFTLDAFINHGKKKPGVSFLRKVLFLESLFVTFVSLSDGLAQNP